jgi:hypothetical protein
MKMKFLLYQHGEYLAEIEADNYEEAKVKCFEDNYISLEEVEEE